jgi:hypothetical protein
VVVVIASMSAPLAAASHARVGVQIVLFIDGSRC